MKNHDNQPTTMKPEEEHENTLENHENNKKK